jgi:shikimate dehydrogenase
VGSAVVGQTVMLLGAGGAARAIAVQLCMAGVGRLLLANRTTTRADALAAFLKQNFHHADISVVTMRESSLAARLPDTDIVVNATSIGMHPQDPLLFPPAALSPQHLVCDIVYRPLQTPLLRAAERQGARTVDGLGMLLHQGAKAFEIWTGSAFPLALIRARLLEAVGEQPATSARPQKE